MPRKRSGHLRRSREPKASWHDVPHVPGLDRHSHHEISRIELRTAQNWAQQGFWPGATAEALSRWRTMSRRPSNGAFLPCDCCGRHPRALLEEILDALPTSAARALVALIDELDDEFHRRTVPDPHLPAALPWWDRRM